LGFFARNLYRRQTAPKVLTAGASAISSGEAYIWVGQVGIQDAAGNLKAVPEQQFSADRILGRMAILLTNISDNSQAPYIGEKPGALAPFGYDTQDFTTYSDVARMTMDQFRQNADAYYQAAGPVNWFRPMEDGANVMRYRCNPTVSRPMTPQALSQSVPFFLGNCTQFIVEYAGDYLRQDPVTGDVVNGKQDLKAGDDQSKNDVSQVMYLDKSVNPQEYRTITGNTDGQIDFIVDAAGSHRVRWYGLPRDTDGDGAIGINDVIPLADVLEYFQITVNGNQPALAPWENQQDLPNPSLKGLGNNYATFPASSANQFKYTCAWHNDAPPMIRILVKIDDPTGKLQDGQWYEYIFSR
jgi:hypothetical protein